MLQYGFAEAQPIKHMECIRAKLNAIADNAEFWRLLDQANAETIKRQSKRNCGAPQPAPHDQDRITYRRRRPPGFELQAVTPNGL